MLNACQQTGDSSSQHAILRFRVEPGMTIAVMLNLIQHLNMQCLDSGTGSRWELIPYLFCQIFVY